MGNLLAGSHLPILARICQISKGNVLELGVGYNSTPLLHWMCADLKYNHSYLFSYETDKKWLELFSEYDTNNHVIDHVENWDEIMLEEMKWGLAFIDCRPAKERRNLALRLKDCTDYIILHDSEPEIDRFYRYSSIYKHFKYRYDYTSVGKPFTVVLSNKYNVERIFEQYE